MFQQRPCDLARAQKDLGGAPHAGARLGGISWWTLLTDGRLVSDSLVLEAPQIVATGHDDAAEGGEAGGSTAASTLVSAIDIAGVRVTGAHVDWARTLDTAEVKWSVDEVDLLLRDLRLDSLAVGARPTQAYASFVLSAAGLTVALPDGVHEATFSRARFDSRAARMTLDRFAVRPTVSEAAFREMANAPPAYATLETHELRLEGFALGAFLRKQHYRARTLRVDSMRADILLADPGDDAASGVGAQKPKLGIDLRLDSLDLAGVALDLRRPRPLTDVRVPRAGLLLTDVRTGPQVDGAEVDVAEVQLRVSAFEYEVPGRDRVVSLDEARLDYAAQRLRVEGLRYGPRDVSASQRAERVTLLMTAREIALDGLEADALLRAEAVAAQSARVEGLRIEATTNLTVPSSRDGRRPIALIQLQQLPVALRLDRTEVTAAEVRYRRIAADSDVTLGFEDTYATVYDVGGASAKTRDARADIKTRFEGALPVDVTVDRPNGRGAPYRLSASTGAYDLTRLNDLTEPLAKLRIEGGRLDALSFAFTADDRRGRGRLEATYGGFRVNVLDASGDDKDVLSLMANVAAVNEDSDGRSGRIRAERAAGMSMWGHWWALIRSGLKEVALTEVGEGQVR